MTITNTAVSRRDVLRGLGAALASPLLDGSVFGQSARTTPPKSVVSTIVGTGAPGFSEVQVNNPYGLVIGPDKGLFFCDLDNQRLRRLDLRTRKLTTIAGNGERGYKGDGGAAT